VMRPVKRCSRPLCSSQPTTSHHPGRPHRTRTPHEGAGGLRPGMALRRESPRNRNRFRVPLPQDPTACLRPRSTPPPPFHAPTGCSTRGRQDTGGRTGQRSTLEHHPDTPRRIGMIHRHRSGVALHRPGGPGR
jgi:hypothetical protein